MMTISILYSIPTKRAQRSNFVATDEDTKETAEDVQQALTGKAHLELVPITEDTIESTISGLKGDLVFNLVEWDGHDTALTLKTVKLLEEKHIPFTGGDSQVLALTADKQHMKQALVDCGIETPRWQVFTTGNEPVSGNFRYPVIAKLLYEHCSVGLTQKAVVHSDTQLAQLVRSRIGEFEEPVMAEEFIIGREFQVTVLQRESGPVVLPPAEIWFDNQDGTAFLTYESRWVPTDPEYKTSHVKVADISLSVRANLEKVSLIAFQSLGMRDYSRLDIRVQNERVIVLEANSNPGLEDDPDYGMSVSFHAAGMTFTDFLWDIVESALRRTKIR